MKFLSREILFTVAFSSCSVQYCNNTTGRFRQFTSLAYKKAQEKGTYTTYNYLTVGQQLCHTHYMSIVESDRNQKSKTPVSMEINEVNREIGKYIK